MQDRLVSLVISLESFVVKYFHSLTTKGAKYNTKDTKGSDYEPGTLTGVSSDS